MNSNIETDTEVLRHEGSHAVATQHHLTFEESTLGHAGVLFLGLDDHDGLVLKEVVDHNPVDAHVFKSAFNHRLLKEAVESENLHIVIEKLSVPVCPA